MIRERIRGSLLGGAIGDALGYPVEFMDRNSILEKFGKNGLSEFCSFDKNGYYLDDDDRNNKYKTGNGYTETKKNNRASSMEQTDKKQIKIGD